MTNQKKDTENFELEVKFVCKKCGRELRADGRHIQHKSGTTSYLVYNVDNECVWCRVERERVAKND